MNRERSAESGLQTAYEGRQLPSGTALTREEYTWTTGANGKPYIGTTITGMNPGNGQAKQTTQQLDQYGNLTQMQIYGFTADTQSQAPTFSSSAIRTYNNTYVTDSAYVQAHIVNRLLSSKVKDASGNTTTLGTYR